MSRSVHSSVGPASKRTVGRFASLASLFFVAFVWVAGCGRSNLDVDVTDGGINPDGGGTCNATTCPTGCCDSAGTCQLGTTASACGTGGGLCAACTNGQSCNAQTHTCGGVIGRCNATSCAGGCCDATGTCKAGSNLNVCGSAGQACEDCVALGFDVCNPQQHRCELKVTTCDASTCPNGCCEPTGPNQFVCIDGHGNLACGTGGKVCQNCASVGAVCDPGGTQCVRPSCGPQNCNGCCVGDQCVPGGDQNACGQFGQQCQNCGPNAVCGGGICQPAKCGPQNCNGCCQNGQCLPGNDPNSCGSFGGQCQFCPPGANCPNGFCQGQTCGPNNCNGCCMNNQCFPGTDPGLCGQFGQQCNPCPPNSTCNNGVCSTTICNPQNCNGCCDAIGKCQQGTANNSCGNFGQFCQDCGPLGETCQGGVCQVLPTCTPANCPGCCDSGNVCHGGFLNDRCGSGGAQCADCTQTGSTCDNQVNPRVCTNQQTTCPAPYPACPAGTTTNPPAVQTVCPAADLADARAACSGGAQSATCQSFFSFESQVNPACSSCLKPFDIRFFEGTGIFLCVAPFVDPGCNGNTGCTTDCENMSCAQCAPGDATACKNAVRQNQCQPYFQQSQCIFNSLFGAASFCNPQNYNFNFGAWLEGVGGHYCGQ